MEAFWVYTILSLLFSIFGLNFLSEWWRNLPPSPALALPIIGHLHLPKMPLHRNFWDLSQKYGKIFSLQMGSRRLVVVSSPSGVQECFTKNDINLANRPRLAITKHIGYNFSSMVALPYGDRWRDLRRLTAGEMFTASRLNMFSSIRNDEIRRFLLKLSKNSKHDFAKVEMKSKLHELSFNVTMRMVAGKRDFGQDEENEEGKSFRELIKEVFEFAGKVNPGDFVPFFRWIDYRNYEKKWAKLAKRMDASLEGLVNEHRRKKDKKKTFVDHLLSLQESQPEYYSDDVLKGLLMGILFAGTDTSSMTLEWALSLLLNNPEVMKKARAELDAKVGTQRLIQETDLSNLPYLNNIILETFRLFPVAPLLLPHESSSDCKIGGYNIPRRTIVIVNAWAIHRDPEVWDDPTSFKPERFEGVEVESWKLMPFGMGRRVCPGAGVAQRILGLALGSLIQSFDWRSIGEEEIDLAEGDGLSMPKAKPLEALCRARNNIIDKIIMAEAE